MNHGSFDGDTLQKLMRHRDYSTRQRYIRMAEKVTAAAPTVFVPEVLKTKKA